MVEKNLTIKKEKPKEDLMWAGGNKLLSKSKSEQHQKEKDSILVISKVLNISPFGINILGGVPYINKLGRREKLSQYGKDKWQVKYRWEQMAKTDTEKAICSACIVNEVGKEISDWVIGEASPASMKMSTLAGYQNHLAQTRAHNRAIDEFIGVKIHQEMLENIAKLQEKKELKTLPAIDLSVSAEEISDVKSKKEKGWQAPEFECSACGEPITKAIAEFSKKMFKKQLCLACQKLELPEEEEVK